MGITSGSELDDFQLLHFAACCDNSLVGFSDELNQSCLSLSAKMECRMHMCVKS